MNAIAFQTAFGFSVSALLLFFVGFGVPVEAATTYTTVASALTVSGDVSDGDIISYDAAGGMYRRSSAFADEMMYGVVVHDPVLYLEGVGASATGTPVVRYGEVTMNVTTLGGTIRAGDLVTSSTVPGAGQRVNRDEGVYVLGFALDDMVTTGETFTDGDGATVSRGTVSVALRIGPYVTREGAAFIASGTIQGVGLADAEGNDGLDVFKLFRYILASFVAISAVIVASRRFGDTFSQSVISIGRNPLAHSHIRSMVLWNAFLILVISGVGFGIGAAIIFAP